MTGRVLLVAVLVVPLSVFVSWGVGAAYAAPLLIPYGCLCGWYVHHLPGVRMPRFPQDHLRLPLKTATT